MKKVTINNHFNVPKNALYFQKTNAEEIFEKTDHPKNFFELSDKEQQTLLNWCGRMETIKSINPKHSSYAIKHWFESSKDGFYITNGQLKGAMILSGYYVGDPDSLNWTFNVSQKSYRVKMTLANANDKPCQNLIK